MFKSSFAEGESNSLEAPCYPGHDHLRRRHVQVEDNFDLLHNILYYLHTDQISFATDVTREPLAKHLPKLCPAEDIYAAADRLFLDELKSKAFNFLKFTCSVENITARALSKFSMLYKEVGDIYATYYRKNWKEVRKTIGRDEFFEERESEGDINNIIELFRRYRIVMEDPDW